jgi:hypothetical protein
MTSKKYADALRVNSVRRHDERHLLYNQGIYARSQQVHHRMLNTTYAPFPKFDDTSPIGFCGSSPSSPWLSRMYDIFMEQHERTISQMTTMLSLIVAAIDHSHKVSGVVSKVTISLM